MTIILKEIKKIFNWKMCLVLLLGSFFIYFLFIEFYIECFPNGRPETDTYNITVKMVNDYGQEMDEKEFEDFKNLYQEKLKQADSFLKNNQEFNNIGINSYEDYLNDNNINSTKEFEDVYWNNLNSEEGTVFWEIQSMEGLIKKYERKDINRQHDKSDDQQERFKSIVANKENISILDECIFWNYNDLIIGTAICIMIGIAFMLTPMFLKDKKNEVEYLQYTNKCGRKLFKSKLVVGFIAAMIITTLELLMLFVLYSKNNTSMFFQSNINSCFNREFWFNMTFLQYIILTVICTYILSIITAFISMFISSKVDNYIKGIGIQVPIMFILVEFTSHRLMDRLNIMYRNKFLVPVIYIVLSVGVISIVVFAVKREKDRAIL